jgi:DNA adenine methylase
LRAQRTLFAEESLSEGSLVVRPTAPAGSGFVARAPSPVDAPATPFLKWAGGKTQLMSQLLPLMPARGIAGRYFEPFVGGGALFFKLSPAQAVLSDLNAELVNCYRTIRTRVEALIQALKKHQYSSEHYYSVRAQRPSDLTEVQRAARFIFLNRTCFNGLHRVNKRGQFNVPFGRYNNPTICDETNLWRVHHALEHTEVNHEGYEHVLERARAGDFVYFDPPYAPISATSNFTSYTASSFGSQQQAELAGVFRALDKRGVKVMLSNSNAPLIHDLYRGFDIKEVYATRAINRDPSRRGKISELVVRNYR